MTKFNHNPHHFSLASARDQSTSRAVSRGRWAGLAAVLSLVVGCGIEGSEGESESLQARSEATQLDSEELQVEAEKTDLCATAAFGKVVIPTRVFSTSPTLGAKDSSVSDFRSPNYGALKVFFDRAARYTRNAVTFSLAPTWKADDGNSIIQQVGANNDPTADKLPRDSAYDNGGTLNPVWGFMYNSIPFGPDFELMVRYLYEAGGLQLAQALVDARGLNVKLLPVVGSNPQGSGYFEHPIGKADCDGEADCLHEKPIGLAGLCTAGWTWRYYGTAQNVIASACSKLVDEKVIPRANIKLGKTVLGQTSLQDVQLGAITAFEYATPLDDLDPPPSGIGYFPPLTAKPIAQASQNPGHKGLRFLHSQGWHQGFYMGWLMVNKSSVWNKISPQNQRAIEQAAKDALEESYWYSWTRQCAALQKILDFNNGQWQLNPDGSLNLSSGHRVSADIKLADWPQDALERLEKASEAYLTSLKGGTTPTADQAQYARVIDAYRSYIKKVGYKWNARMFDYSSMCFERHNR